MQAWNKEENSECDKTPGGIVPWLKQQQNATATKLQDIYRYTDIAFHLDGGWLILHTHAFVQCVEDIKNMTYNTASFQFWEHTIVRGKFQPSDRPDFGI